VPKSCCVKPIAKIIKVDNFEAGIVGLETAMQNVYRSGITDEEQVKTELLQLVKYFDNFITPSTESEYRDALLREYRTFVAKMERGQKQENSLNR
jgi:hypothetical protein